MGEQYRVNSEQSKAAYHRQVDLWYEECKYLTFVPPRKGEDRSLDQNALFHVWCTEWIANKLGRHVKTITVAELAGMKRTVKKMYLIANPDSRFWMTHEITDYSTGLKKVDYTSSADWNHGEMFSVLTFMQNEAASQGVILESKGKFAKLQSEQNV